MFKYLSLAAGIFISVSSFSQKIQLINSGEVLESGKVSYDSGNYKSAIKKYLTITPRDTNYVASLAELALTYLGATEYDKAIEICDKGLENPSEYRPHLLRSKAIALDKKGDYAKSVALFEKTIAEYPLDAVLIYNLGITQFNAKEFAKAKDLFFRVLSVNPFHAGSHRGLARIAILEGRKAHGMLAMGLYLSINPTDNDNLVMINNFVLNQVTDEGSITASGVNSFDKLDQIIRAKMAMDKNFESKFPFDYAIVRQFEMLFQQIDMGASETNDAYRNLYAPMYKHFRDNGFLDPFIYNLVKSTGNDQVKKWLKKNDKGLKQFYDGAGAFIRTKRDHPFLPESFGLGNDYAAFHNDNGRLVSVGKKSADGKMIGKWYFFHSNMEKSAEGSFDKSENKIGIWKYYNNERTLTKTENHDNGEQTFYHKEGTVYQHFFLVKDSIEGVAEVNYPCGSIKDKYLYKENKRHGKGVSYFPDGKVQSEFNYKMGKLDGELKTYYENGKLLSILVYKDDKAEGPYKKYFANGKTEIVGKYVNDLREGEWSYFYFNGKPDRKGVYKEGVGVGEWLFYNNAGELIEKRTFDQKGSYHGENTSYTNGKIHYIKTFKNDVMTRVVFFDENGKEIGKSEKDNGTFAGKTYYSTGQLSAEGNYKNGKEQGPWKSYFRYGGLEKEYVYKEGELNGPGVEYYPGGTKKSSAYYKDDQLHGYYQSFHPNGQVSEEGWYQDGQRQQQWLAYHMDGSVESDEFYLNGVNTTHAFDFAPEGGISVRREFDEEGNLESVMLYHPDGSPASIMKESGKKRIYESTFRNKKTQSHFEILCGGYYGMIARYFPDGKPFYSYNLFNGKREGKFQYFEMSNQLEREGNYIDGWAEGLWKGYENGKLDYVGRYLNNNFDSTWTYYNESGKVSSTATYMRGERNGLSTTQNAEGGPAIEKMYLSDDLVAFRTMRADGTWSDWTKFTGNASIVAYYSNGAKAIEEEYKNGYITGPKRHYFSNGKVVSEFIFKNGDYEGPYVRYYANGKVREKGEYRSDELHGKLEWYNEDGTLSKTENYNYGVRTGKAATYQKGVKKEYTFWGSNVYE
jgi:uncharacterized protein